MLGEHSSKWNKLAAAASTFRGLVFLCTFKTAVLAVFSMSSHSPPETMNGHAQCYVASQCVRGYVSTVMCAQINCQARQLCQYLSLASAHAALYLFMRLELSCITKSFARWMCRSSDRSQGRAITQTLAESAASPASGKTNKTIWLLRAQQSSGLWIYTHQFAVLKYKSSYYRKLSWYFIGN